MGRDVLLLYMSPKNPNYKTQTNEGAVRYLIKEKEPPDCILALCSERVRKEAKEMPDGSTCTTLEYFRDALRRVGIPEERLVVIEVPDSMDDEKKQFQAISQLLEKINEGGHPFHRPFRWHAGHCHAAGDRCPLYAGPAQSGDPPGDLCGAARGRACRA